MKKLLKIYPWDFVQIQLNDLDWYYGDARELYDILEEAGIPVIIMEPVRGGKLASLTPDADDVQRSGFSGFHCILGNAVCDEPSPGAGRIERHVRSGAGGG